MAYISENSYLAKTNMDEHFQISLGESVGYGHRPDIFVWTFDAELDIIYDEYFNLYPF